MRLRNPRLRVAAFLVICAFAAGAVLPASGPAVPVEAARAGIGTIQAGELREWLTYLASDELEGRATFSEGLALAGAFIANHLAEWGVRPGGDNGGYFQRVPVLGAKSDHASTVTVVVNGKERTFQQGAGVTFPRNAGGPRTLVVEEVEFLGYGLNVPAAGHDDYAGRDVAGKAVVWLGAQGPKGPAASARGALRGRARHATETANAAASIGPATPMGAGFTPPAAQQSLVETPDFTTVVPLDRPAAPQITADDSFFEFLFSGAEISYAELKKKAENQESLPPFTLDGVRLIFNVDPRYRVVRTQYTRNVVGIVEGSDPKLKDSYVVFGAHYDHVGYAVGEVVEEAGGSRRVQPVGRVGPGAVEDRFWNGADDNGSGSVALMAIAKAFAEGPKPRRSMVFVWFSGEERGLWGSRYHAESPGFDLQNAAAMVNMDMIGRNRDDREEHANTVYLIGSDRISTELHNIAVEANDRLPRPLELDFELNDPADPEQLYFRSDHYSYAAKGIPSIFLTTGLHPDYHYNTDHVEKINFEKMTRIAQLAYEIGWSVGTIGTPPARDFKGPRAGKGSQGKIFDE
jgi:hypothetical protein